MKLSSNLKRERILLPTIALLVLLLATACTGLRTLGTSLGSQSASPPCFNCGTILDGHVTRVLDGDTLEVTDQNRQTFRIRLQGIDAPEKTQAYGPEAKELLTKLTLNRDVEIIWSEKDLYGRVIGKVTIVRACPSCPHYKPANPDGSCSKGDCEKDVCLEMISAGLAWHFTRYEQTQSNQDRILYSQTEKRVRGQHIGLWRDVNPTPPWDYRKNQRGSLLMHPNGKNGGPKTDDELVTRTLDEMAESVRLQDLTDLELIAATIADPIGDDNRVHELMSRLNPEWTNDLSTTRDPLRPSYISLTVPLNVARTAIAYDHCRCTAEGNLDRNSNPCLYCALRASVYRATKDPLYQAEDAHDS